MKPLVAKRIELIKLVVISAECVAAAVRGLRGMRGGVWLAGAARCAFAIG